MLRQAEDAGEKPDLHRLFFADLKEWFGAFQNVHWRKPSKKPDDVKERAALEVFIARDIHGLDASDWEHLTGTFTYRGESDTKSELDEIIQLSRRAWSG